MPNVDGIVADLIDAIEIGIVPEAVDIDDGTALLRVSTDEQFLIKVERVSGPGPHTMQADLAIRALVKLLSEDWPNSQQIVPAASEAYSHNTSPAELGALRAQVGHQTIAEFLGCQGYPHCHCTQEGAPAGVESGNTSKSG